jgi:hypothetical protein
LAALVRLQILTFDDDTLPSRAAQLGIACAVVFAIAARRSGAKRAPAPGPADVLAVSIGVAAIAYSALYAVNASAAIESAEVPCFVVGEDTKRAWKSLAFACPLEDGRELRGASRIHGEERPNVFGLRLTRGRLGVWYATRSMGELVVRAWETKAETEAPPPLRQRTSNQTGPR